MIKEAIERLVDGRSLTQGEAEQVMKEIMDGLATPAQLGAFLVALRLKGEQPDELLGMAKVMRAKATAVKTDGEVLDTCGTGGDGVRSFNISTAAAFVAAAAGLKVAKHGNRAVSSTCGSADVIEALGGHIDFGPKEAKEALDKVGFAFLFAPNYHPAMKFAAGPRSEIGIRTIFNFLGPLANPAGAKYQLLGVSDPRLADSMAPILRSLGAKHAVVVHGEDGLDEVTLSGLTRVYEVKGDRTYKYSLSPEDFGYRRTTSSKDLLGGPPQENAKTMREIFGGVKGRKRDSVVLNSAAALLAGEKVESMQEGVTLASQTIDSGAALAKLEEYVKFVPSTAK